MTNEEPLVVVKVCVDVVREVVREDRGDGRDGMIRERETSLRRGRCRSVRQRTFGAEDGHIGCSWRICGHRGSKVFASGGRDKDVVGVNGDVLVERGKKESVKNLLGDLGRSRRHR